jgi:hypothetical protein
MQANLKVHIVELNTGRRLLFTHIFELNGANAIRCRASGMHAVFWRGSPCLQIMIENRDNVYISGVGAGKRPAGASLVLGRRNKERSRGGRSISKLDKSVRVQDKLTVDSAVVVKIKSDVDRSRVGIIKIGSGNHAAIGAKVCIGGCGVKSRAGRINKCSA